jgi:SpoVK/Ycf46/Vps4 family AAA+-type ATPase
MGSTNRKDAIDEAFLRRMPLQIYVGLPNQAQRVQLLEHFLRDTPGADTLDLVGLAHRMDGFSGSVMEDCCKDACLNPVNDSMDLSSATIPGDSSPPISVRPLTFADFFTNGVLHHTNRVSSNHIKSGQPGSRTTQALYVLYITIVILLACLAGPRLFHSIRLVARLPTMLVFICTFAALCVFTFINFRTTRPQQNQPCTIRQLCTENVVADELSPDTPYIQVEIPLKCSDLKSRIITIITDSHDQGS